MDHHTQQDMDESDPCIVYFPYKHESSSDKCSIQTDPLAGGEIKKEIEIKREGKDSSIEEDVEYCGGIHKSTRNRKKRKRKKEKKSLENSKLYPNVSAVKDAVVNKLLSGKKGTLGCVQYKGVTLSRKGNNKGYWVDGGEMERFKREIGGKSVYCCEDCDYSVEYKSTFKVHFITHANLYFIIETINKTLDKNYCYICDMECYSASLLSRHLKTHKHKQSSEKKGEEKVKINDNLEYVTIKRIVEDVKEDIQPVPLCTSLRRFSKSSDEWSSDGVDLFGDDNLFDGATQGDDADTLQQSDDDDNIALSKIVRRDIKLEEHFIENRDEIKCRDGFITKIETKDDILNDLKIENGCDTAAVETKDSLKCESCHYETEQPDQLLYHDCIYVQKCDLCGKILINEKILQFHRKQHFCDKCTFQSSIINEVVEHRKNSLGCWYSCSNCTFKTLYKASFKKHNIDKKCYSNDDQTSEILYCDTCQYNTRFKDILIKHIKQHSDPMRDANGTKCRFCDYIFISSSRAELTEHTKNSPKCSYKCSKCDFKCVHINTMRTHVKWECGKPRKRQRKKKILCCHICEFTTTNRGDLTYHIRKHTKPFQCDQCDFRCSQRSNLNIHFKKHIKEKSYSCTLCNFQCDRLRMFLDHKKSHGLDTTTPMTQDTSLRDPRFFYCDRCDFRSKHGYYFKAHVLKHDNILPHLCAVCGAGFSSVMVYHLHKKSHEQKTPVKKQLKNYKCTYCDYTCNYRTTIKVHERRHSGEKPYKCTYCDYRSNLKATVNIHERKHTGHKPHRCDMCPYTTSYAGNLYAHRKKHL